MRRDGSFVKVERINQIRREIAKNLPNPVDLEKLRIWVECNIGLSKQKAEEYIDIVVSSAGWIIVDGKIVIAT
jgi:hypothetical protein